MIIVLLVGFSDQISFNGYLTFVFQIFYFRKIFVLHSICLLLHLCDYAMMAAGPNKLSENLKWYLIVVEL